MFALIKRYRELIVVSALLLYPFASFMAKGRGVTREPNVIDRVVLAVTSPLQRGMGWAIDGVVSGWTGYVYLTGVKAENDLLKLENAELRARVQKLAEAELQNERLRELLAYTESNIGGEVTARVIGVNPDPRLLSVRINRGTDDGVVHGAAVITADGVVGQVIRATGGYADVLLLKDPSSRIAVRVQRTRARATAAGVRGDLPLSLENLLRTEDLQEGDVIVTAGTDGVFPPGVMVGKATNVEKTNQGMFQTAEVVPAVDITRLEEVLVLPPVDWKTSVGSAQAPTPQGAPQ